MPGINRVGGPQGPSSAEGQEVQHGHQGQQGNSSQGVAGSPNVLERAEASDNPFSAEPHGRPFTDPDFQPENAKGRPFTDAAFVAEKGGVDGAVIPQEDAAPANPLPSITDGTSNTIIVEEKLPAETEQQEGSARERTLPSIGDGTSNTLLLGEE